MNEQIYIIKQKKTIGNAACKVDASVCAPECNDQVVVAAGATTRITGWRCTFDKLPRTAVTGQRRPNKGDKVGAAAAAAAAAEVGARPDGENQHMIESQLGVKKIKYIQNNSK